MHILYICVKQKYNVLPLHLLVFVKQEVTGDISSIILSLEYFLTKMTENVCLWCKNKPHYMKKDTN